jgi:acetoin utilization deacetylase AcuC-like enzyme
VFYRDEMVADAHSYSPSASKPRHVLAAWRAARLPISIVSFEPATPEDLALAHDPAYVTGVLSRELPNGFGNLLAEVAHSLPYTTGAMLAAAQHALKQGIACAPVSGFHHAHFDSGGGFCTFNDLVVTAARLLGEGRVRRVLILDCDQHFGDGTDDILAKLSLFDAVTNATFGRWFRLPKHATAYLLKLRDIAGRLQEYDLVLDQAGADVHVHDPLGGVLTTKQMMERDRIVFEAARSTSVPLAWNIAGGYQEPVDNVLELHTNTMRECARAFASGDDRSAASPGGCR